MNDVSENLAVWCEQNEDHITHQFFRPNEIEDNEDTIREILNDCQDPDNWEFDYEVHGGHEERWNCVPFHRQLFGYVKKDGSVRIVQGE